MSDARSGDDVPADLQLQFLIVLAGTEPLVWRRIRVPASYSFWDLHVAIQDAMGWLDCHLHLFRVLDPRSGTQVILGIPDPDLVADRSLSASWTEQPVHFTTGSASIFRYTYDLGDSWEHAIVFEGFHYSELPNNEPELLGGAGACPPEDSGGAEHYSHVVAALRDPSHPDHDEYLEWAGGPIDPTAFSPEDVSFDDPQRRWQFALGDHEPE